MLNAVRYMTKQADGRHKGHLCTVSIKIEINVLPNIQKTVYGQPDFRVVTEGIDIGAG